MNDKSFQNSIIGCMSNIALYFPLIQKKSYPSRVPGYKKEVYYCTYLRKQQNGKWYIILHVESGIVKSDIEDELILAKLIEVVYKSMLFYKKTEYEDWDQCQLSEEERLEQGIVKPILL